MRQILQNFRNAMLAGKDWKQGNYEVVIKIGCEAHCYLHGNRIAIGLLHNREVLPDLLTIREYPTATTTAALRALGCDVTFRSAVPEIIAEEVYPMVEIGRGMQYL